MQGSQIMATAHCREICTKGFFKENWACHLEKISLGLKGSIIWAARQDHLLFLRKSLMKFQIFICLIYMTFSVSIQQAKPLKFRKGPRAGIFALPSSIYFWGSCLFPWDLKSELRVFLESWKLQSIKKTLLEIKQYTGLKMFLLQMPSSKPHMKSR